jgi:hypothetical protein
LQFEPIKLDILLLSADVCLDGTAEARRMNAHLHAAQTHANSIADNFWADRSKAMKLTLLQDRIAQAGVLAKMSRSALSLVHEAMFSLNNQPEGLPMLLDRFENGNAVYSFVREHLRCGAMVALSFVHAHYPEVNLKLLKTLPPSPSGRLTWINIMLLAETQPIVSPSRLSPKVIVRGQIKASQCTDLA